MPERFKVVLDDARRYISAQLYLYLNGIIAELNRKLSCHK